MMKASLLSLSITTTVLALSPAVADSLKRTAVLGGGEVVTQVMNSTYGSGTVTLQWTIDANLAGTLMKTDPSSPLLVPGVNPDGSMSLSVAAAFVANLNHQAYLGIHNWQLPTTFPQDLSCSFTASKTGNKFGFGCALPVYNAPPPQILTIPNPSYVFSELAALFNALGGQAHDSIKATHNDKLSLFEHVQPYLYWSQTAQTNNFEFGNDFWFQNGFEGTENQYDSMYVWPVAIDETSTTDPAPTMLQACAVGVMPQDANPTNFPDCNGVVVVAPGLGLLPGEVLPAPANTLQTSTDGKLIYDPVAQVTYLADANLAKTLLDLKANAVATKPLPPETQYLVGNINPDGSMNQTVLVKFLNALNAGANSGVAEPYLGIDTWNTPVTELGGYDPYCSIQKEKVPSYGYNCDGTSGNFGSDLGELFYNQLGGVAGETVKNPKSASGRLFKNLKADYYWQCQLPATTTGGCGHPVPNALIPSFSFRVGYQGLQSDVNELFVMLATQGNAIPTYEQWLLTH